MFYIRVYMEREETAIIIAGFTLAFLSMMVVLLFAVFQKRKNALLLKQEESEKKFEKELLKTQIEIREETFRNISWELHDNIGQLVTLAKIQVQNSSKNEDIKLTLEKALKELRTISKVINPEFIKNINILEAIEYEIARLNRLMYIDSKLLVRGELRAIDKKNEIILFRIFQEILSNIIKHAKATHLKTTVDSSKQELIITIEDNGQGFDVSKKNQNGLGLINIKSRAALINANIKIKSEINEGTTLTIIYPYSK